MRCSTPIARARPKRWNATIGTRGIAGRGGHADLRAARPRQATGRPRRHRRHHAGRCAAFGGGRTWLRELGRAAGVCVDMPDSGADPEARAARCSTGAGRARIAPHARVGYVIDLLAQRRRASGRRRTDDRRDARDVARSAASPHSRWRLESRHRRGVRHLAQLPDLRHLDLSGTAMTDAGLAVLAIFRGWSALARRNGHHRRRRRATGALPRTAQRSARLDATLVTALSEPSPGKRKLHTSRAARSPMTGWRCCTRSPCSRPGTVARRRWRCGPVRGRTTSPSAVRSPIAACEICADSMDSSHSTWTTPARDHGRCDEAARVAAPPRLAGSGREG